MVLQRTEKWLQTHFSSNPSEEKWLQTHFMLQFRSLEAEIWWSNEMWEKTKRGKWKRGKILAEIFWGKWEMVFEWAMVISNSSTELTWQHRRNGSHRVQKFTLMPLSYVTQKQKTTFCCFRFSSLSLNPNWVWVMKTGRENQPNTQNCVGPT